MKGTIDYLDALRDHFRVTSDYAVAQRLGITRAAISGYRHGRSLFSDEIALKVADALHIPRREVLLSIYAERAAKSSSKAVAEAFADAYHHLGGIAA